MRLDHAQRIAADVVMKLRPYCEKIEVAGSIRRMAPHCGDIEVVVIPKQLPQPSLLGADEMVRHPGFAKCVAQWKKVKGDAANGKYTQRIIMLDLPSVNEKEFKLDIFTADKNNFGYIMAIRTGSEEFSKRLANRWVELGLHGDAGFLYKDGEKMLTPTEEDFFKLLKLDYVEPHKRNIPSPPKPKN